MPGDAGGGLVGLGSRSGLHPVVVPYGCHLNPHSYFVSLPLETKKGNVPGAFPLSFDTVGQVYVAVPKVVVPLRGTTLRQLYAHLCRIFFP